MTSNVQVGVTHNRALCCECGTVRTYSQKAGMRNHRTRGYSPAEIAEHRPKRPHLWEGIEPWQRQLADFKCRTCARVTRHALILDTFPSRRDYDEKQDGPIGPVVDLAGQIVLEREIERLEGFGIRFEYRDCGPDTQPTTLEVEQTLFDGSWTFTLNKSVPAQILYEAVDDVWQWISDRERCSKIRWVSNESARYAAFTYRDKWITHYIELSADETSRLAQLWAYATGELS